MATIPNYGRLASAVAHASTSEVLSDVLDVPPDANGVTAWVRDTVGGTLTPYYLPLGFTNVATDKIAIDGTSADDDYRVTVTAAKLARCTINHGVKNIVFGFTPSASTAGTLNIDAFATGVKL